MKDLRTSCSEKERMRKLHKTHQYAVCKAQKGPYRERTNVAKLDEKRRELSED